MKHGSVQENLKGRPVLTITIPEILETLQTSEHDPPSATHSSSPPLRNPADPTRVTPITVWFHVENLFDG